MLVFRRRQSENVVIGGRHRSDQVVKVTVLEIRGLYVKLGFEAADHVAVHRGEVWERICSQDFASSTLPSAGPGAAQTLIEEDGNGRRREEPEDDEAALRQHPS